MFGDQGFLLSTSTCEWVAEQLRSYNITKELVLSASSHVPQVFIKDLFSEDPWKKSIAKGYFYESAIYEAIFRLARSSNRIRRLTRKGADVSQGRLGPRPALGQDGLFYSPFGELKIRGNGVDLVEVDFVLEDSEGGMLVGESKLSGGFLADDFVEAVNFKRRLLTFLLSKEIQSILISPANLAEHPKARPLLGSKWNNFAKTGKIEEVLAGLTPAQIPPKTMRARNDGKLIYWTDFRQVRPLNYSKLHNITRDAILRGVKANVKILQMVKEHEESLLKNVWIGVLNEQAISALLEKKTLRVESRNLGAQVYDKFFSKMVLGLSLPELRPGLYLKSILKPNYIKLGPYTSSEFGFERLLRKKYTPYYDWLNSISVPIGAPKLMSLLDYFLRENLMGARIKKGMPKRELSELFGVESKKPRSKDSK